MVHTLVDFREGINADGGLRPPLFYFCRCGTTGGTTPILIVFDGFDISASKITPKMAK